MFITMTLVLKDADETFMAETETRPRHWKIPPRRDVGYVSRPRRRDRDYIPGNESLNSNIFL